jgi:hypothetical protein
LEAIVKKVLCDRFAILRKGGGLVKPFSDEIPYLLFKRRMDAEKCLAMEKLGTHKIIKVRVTIEVLS